MKQIFKLINILVLFFISTSFQIEEQKVTCYVFEGDTRVEHFKISMDNGKDLTYKEVLNLSDDLFDVLIEYDNQKLVKFSGIPKCFFETDIELVFNILSDSSECLIITSAFNGGLEIIGRRTLERCEIYNELTIIGQRCSR